MRNGFGFSIFLALISCVLGSVSYRLPTSARPHSYDVKLNINPEKDTFVGNVTIVLDIESSSNEEINTLKLHIGHDYLNVSKVAFNGDAEMCNVTGIDNVTDIANVTCKGKISGINQTLQLNYTGKISSDDMLGIYKSMYSEDKVNKTLVASQFEPSYARRAFPCFDEPSFKAVFNVSVTAPKKYTVWSNTKVKKSIDNGDNTNTTVFNPTPKMPAYLVAVIVSEFETFENTKLKEDYTFSVISRASAGEYTSIAVKYGPILIDLMGNWTNIPYASLGNDKQDLAAIPDFAAGAMENWGLITYKEEALLDEKEKTSNAAKQTVITVIAHELAHQWFGDYVTMNWWSETWLNEGFATYFEFHNANNLNESLELDKQFVNLVHQYALSLDCVMSALPLSNNDSEINSLAEQVKKFDSITYQKGGSIVRMMKYVLGEDAFRKGLNNYLNANNHNNTKAETLLKYLDEVAPKTAESFSTYMNAWIYKPGYPILEASLDNDTVSIKNKRRYLLTGSNSTEWYVPLSYTTSSSPDFEKVNAHWLEPNYTLYMTLKDKNDWIIFNIQSSGLYRVNYDTILWSRISDVLNTTPEKIHVLNRALLVNDVFNIAKIGDIDYNTTFNLAKYIANETEYYPWYSFLTEVDYLLWKIKDDKTKNQLVNQTLQLLSKAIEIPSTNSNENLTHIQVIQRSLILKWACKLGHQGCLEYAKNEFENYKKNASSDNIDHNLRSLIFCYGLKNSTNQSADFDFLFNIYPSSNSPYEKNDVLSALGCSSDKKIIENYLLKSIAAGSQIRLQDASKVFRAVYASGSEGVSVALEFMENHMEDILKKYKGFSSIDSLLIGISSFVVKEDDITRLQNIIDKNKNVDAIVISGKQALEVAAANKKWSDERENGVTSALLYNGNPVPNSTAGFYLNTVLLCIVAVVYIMF